MFHLFEIGFAGYSGSGKTTLITRLLKAMPEFNIGYAKHDAHHFDMDKPGKDTFVARESGAQIVAINSAEAFACLGKKARHQTDQSQLFLDLDFVFVEGYKDSSIPKILIIDDEQEIIKDLERFNNIIAFAGKQSSMANLPSTIPYFQLDNIDEIKSFILQYISNRVKQIPLLGLVLVGGKSTRMGTDKAALSYNGKSQSQNCVDLLSSFVDQVYISSRKDQTYISNDQATVIHDTFIDKGPMGGILSAMDVNPQAAWIILACDLPFVDKNTIRKLIEGRNPFKIATAYQSVVDGLPEPLCAIYEPKSRLRLMQFLSYGIQCPRKVLLNSDVKFLTLNGENNTLKNINHWQEYEETKRELDEKKVNA